MGAGHKDDLIPYIKTLFPTEESCLFDMVFIETIWFENEDKIPEEKIFAISPAGQKYLSVVDVWKDSNFK